MPVIKNVMINYAKVDKPVLKYEQEEVKDSPFKNKEYLVDICLKASSFKALKKKYGSSVKSFKEAKTLTAKEYLKAFQVEAPEGYANDDDEFYVMKFRKLAAYKDGTPTDKPEVVGVKGKKDMDGNVVGANVGIGNGTEANVQFRERKYQHKGKSGLVLDLVALQILHLIEYSTGLEFEMEEEDEDEFSDDEDFSTGSADGADDTEQEPANPEDDDWEDD